MLACELVDLESSIRCYPVVHDGRGLVAHPFHLFVRFGLIQEIPIVVKIESVGIDFLLRIKTECGKVTIFGEKWKRIAGAF